MDIGTFDPETTVYEAAVPADLAATTATAEPADANAAVEIADAQGSTLGTDRTTQLATGTKEIAATVTAEDGRSERRYAVTVTRAEAWGARRPARDIALGGDGESTGVWSDGEMLWALSDCDGGTAQAYELATGARLGGRDLGLDDGFSQTALWSDGETLWVVDGEGRKLYAYAEPGLARPASSGLLPVRVTSRAPAVLPALRRLPARSVYGSMRPKTARCQRSRTTGSRCVFIATRGRTPENRTPITHPGAVGLGFRSGAF